jgi:hypothetical protein
MTPLAGIAALGAAVAIGSVIPKSIRLSRIIQDGLNATTCKEAVAKLGEALRIGEDIVQTPDRGFDVEQIINEELRPLGQHVERLCA